MYENSFPNKRYEQTLHFLRKHINTNESILDLGVKNPNIVKEIDERTPKQIISEIEELDKKNSDILKKIKRYS